MYISGMVNGADLKDRLCLSISDLAGPTCIQMSIFGVKRPKCFEAQQHIFYSRVWSSGGHGKPVVVVCVVNILEARADSRFYRVLLKLEGLSSALGSLGLNVYTPRVDVLRVRMKRF